MNSRSDSPEVDYEPTTPAKPVKSATARKTVSRTAAGPSKRVANPPKRPKNKKASPDVSEIEVDPPEQDHIDIPSGSENEQPKIPKPSAKQPTSRATSIQVNGKVAAKGKGKAKEKPILNEPDSLMDVNEIEDLTGLGDGKLARPTKVGSLKDTEVSRYRKQLEQKDKQIKQLEKQVEDLLTAANERESAFDEWKAQQQETDELFRAYRKEVTQLQRSSPDSNALSLHFLSRQDAEEAKKEVENQIGDLQETIRKKDLMLKEKDATIADMKEQQKTLRSDLNAEIERGNALAKPKPAGHTRNQSHILENLETTKKGAVVLLYEDITNILVVDVKTERNLQMNEDEFIFKCVYTHVGEEENSPKISLSFQLRHYPDVKEDGGVVQNIRYTPLDLDKETPSFRETLEFLDSTFTFERHQLQVFYDQLREHAAGAADAAAQVIDLRSDNGDDMYA